MKKLSAVLLGLVLSVSLWMGTAKATTDITVTATPSDGHVGDTINLSIKMTDTPQGARQVWLLISDSDNNPNGFDHPRKIFTAPEAGKNATFNYSWDTASSQSESGYHEINVCVVDKEFKISNNTCLANGYLQYNLGSKISSNTNSSGSNTNTGTDQNGTKSSGGTSSTSSALPGFPDVSKYVLSKDTDPVSVVRNILSWVLLLAGIIAVIYLIYGGILYITAGGDAEKATKGRIAVVNAVIGLIIIVTSFVIVQFVITAVSRVA